MLVSIQASFSLYEGDRDAAKAHARAVRGLISTNRSFDLSTCGY